MTGIRYTGPYAEQVEDHEGHAARKLADGTLTTEWTEETSTLHAFVAACSCGWLAEVEHPATEAGKEAAEAHWNAEHLSPLIDAARASWESWPDDLRGLARYVQDRMHAQDATEALRILDQIVADVDYRRRTVTQLAAQQQRPARELGDHVCADPRHGDGAEAQVRHSSEQIYGDWGRHSPAGVCSVLGVEREQNVRWHGR
jgi:hypothetical protein